MLRAAAIEADKPEAHKRFTVSPGTVYGKPASNNAIRATLRLSSPAWFAQPMITSPICFTSMFALRFTNSFKTNAAKSSVRIVDNVPPKFPIGVRTPSIINACFIIYFFSPYEL